MVFEYLRTDGLRRYRPSDGARKFFFPLSQRSCHDSRRGPGCPRQDEPLAALLNYYIAVWFGRPVLNKYGKYAFMPPHRLDKVEHFFVEHGEISTFTGRLIPAVRQYISFPAGLSRMNLFRFLLFTGLGAGIWVTILVWIGYAAGTQLDNITSESITELWHQYSTEITIGLILFCGLLIGAYILWYRRKKRVRA